MEAKFVRYVDGWRGSVQLYILDTPYDYANDWGPAKEREPKWCDHILISAVTVPFSGPETYIFPAKEDGTALEMLELQGSYRGGLDHKTALLGFLMHTNPKPSPGRKTWRT